MIEPLPVSRLSARLTCFFVRQFLVTDSSALTDFRHHPLALRLQVLEEKLANLETNRCFYP